MTDIATTDNRKLGGSREAPPVTSQPVTSVTNSTEAQVLVTEQQVLFSTAAAVALPPAKIRRFGDTIHQAVSAAVRAIFAAPEKPPARRHYPKRLGFLESALMSREMDRL